MKESMVIGLGMNGRGAVELVVATVVIKLSNELLKANRITEPLLTQEQFSAFVLMAFITSLITPILLKYHVFRSCSISEKESYCVLASEEKKRIAKNA